MKKMLVQASHLAKCPFCGINKQYITSEIVEGNDYLMHDGRLVPAVKVVIYCHKCGAMMRALAPDEDTAVKIAVESWRKRDGVQ